MKLLLMVFAIVGATSVVAKEPETKGIDFETNVLTAPGARYVLGQISKNRKDQYLLNTETGRVWQLVIDKEGTLFLQPIFFQSLQGKMVATPLAEE